MAVGNDGDTLTTSLNRIAHTTGLTDTAAANVWAGSTTKTLVSAVNAAVGLQGALRVLATEPDHGVAGLAQSIPTP